MCLNTTNYLSTFVTEFAILIHSNAVYISVRV